MMMSPDYPLHTFIQEDFSMLRRMCCTITLYARYEYPLSALYDGQCSWALMAT